MGLFQSLLIAFNLKSTEDDVAIVFLDGAEHYSPDGCACVECGKSYEAHQPPVAAEQTAFKTSLAALEGSFTGTNPAFYKAMKEQALAQSTFAITMAEFAALQKKQAQSLTELKKQVNQTMYTKAQGVVAKGDNAVEAVASDLAKVTGLAASEIKEMLLSMAKEGGVHNLPAMKYQQLMEGVITPQQFKASVSGAAYAKAPYAGPPTYKKWSNQVAGQWGWDTTSVSIAARQVQGVVCRCRHDVAFHARLYDPAGDPVNRCLKCSCTDKRVVKGDMTVIAAQCDRCRSTTAPIAIVHEAKQGDVLDLQCPECGFSYVRQIMKGPFDTIMDPEVAKGMTKDEAKAKLAKMKNYSIAETGVWPPADYIPPKIKPFKITDV